MKKLFCFIALLLLMGCSNTNSNKELSIVVPSGAPSLAFYSEKDNPLFNTADASSIIPELMSDNGSDVIVVDTVNGVKAINSGANYSLAASITFGNFYLASTGNDEDGIMNEGDYIVLFSKGATPDLIFHYLFKDKYDSSIHYVSAVSDASACLIKGINISDDSSKVDYVMIAEPALTMALSQNERASVYLDIQNEYKKTSGGMPMIQASIFVSNKLEKKDIENFLSKIKENINFILDNPNIFSDSVVNMSDTEVKDLFGIPNSKIAYKVLKENSIGLGFIDAYNNKDNIDQYLSLFDIGETNEEIYFK